MRQRSIELMDDKDVSKLETLTPNDNRDLPTSRVKRIMNPPAVALIPGSMSLLRLDQEDQPTLLRCRHRALIKHGSNSRCPSRPKFCPSLRLAGCYIRSAERCRSIKVTEFERRQLAAVRKELDQEYEAQVGLKTQLSKDAAPVKISSNLRT
jgi:hypothetical protein